MYISKITTAELLDKAKQPVLSLTHIIKHHKNTAQKLLNMKNGYALPGETCDLNVLINAQCVIRSREQMMIYIF